MSQVRPRMMVCSSESLGGDGEREDDDEKEGECERERERPRRRCDSRSDERRRDMLDERPRDEVEEPWRRIGGTQGRREAASGERSCED